MIKASELRTKTINELNKMLQDQHKVLEDYVGDVYKGKEKNVANVKFLKKDLARIKTVIAEKKFLEEVEDVKETN
jgi:large subunit ribosomal protein L29